MVIFTEKYELCSIQHILEELKLLKATFLIMHDLNTFGTNVMCSNRHYFKEIFVTETYTDIPFCDLFSYSMQLSFQKGT